MAGDVLSVEDDQQPGEKLLQLVMRGGRRLNPSPALSEIRAHARRELERLPEPLRQLAPHASYPVEVSDRLLKLAAEVDRRLGLRETT
jgi:nicotinate phosphoribosyltransferase